MKGSKRERWLKDGLKVSKHWYKPMWNRRVRHCKTNYSNCGYKKLAGSSKWDGIP